VRDHDGARGATGTATFGNVLVPLDGSPLAACALDAIGDAIGPSGLHLHLLQVISDLPRLAELPYETMGVIRPAAERHLRETAECLIDAGYRVSTEVRGGEVDQEIAAVADEHEVDLIAMATHGRGGFSRLLLGSIAGRVLEASTRPLLLVRPQKATIEAAAARQAVHLHEAAAEGSALVLRPVAEIMATPAIVADTETPQVDVVALMLTHHVGAVPVVDGEGRLQGIVTETDVAGSAAVPLGAFQAARLAGAADDEAAAAVRERGRTLTAAQLMRQPVEFADEQTPIKRVIERMVTADLSHMPVVRAGVPVGMVSRRDLMRLLLPRA
jgi:nucleotide-binding universal stress UspA family protein/CBS domain-containing protein